MTRILRRRDHAYADAPGRPVLAFALAFAALLFLVQTSFHTHPNGQEQAGCQLCRIVHSGILAHPSLTLAVAPLIPSGQIRPSAPVIHPEELCLTSPSRAPPAV